MNLKSISIIISFLLFNKKVLSSPIEDNIIKSILPNNDNEISVFELDVANDLDVEMEVPIEELDMANVADSNSEFETEFDEIDFEVETDYETVYEIETIYEFVTDYEIETDYEVEMVLEIIPNDEVIIIKYKI